MTSLKRYKWIQYLEAFLNCSTLQIIPDLVSVTNLIWLENTRLHESTSWNKKHETLSLWNGGTKIMQISIREALLQNMDLRTENIISTLHFQRKRKFLIKLNQPLISKLDCNDLAKVQGIIDHNEQQKVNKNISVLQITMT